MISLNHGPATAAISPADGGSVLSFGVGGRSILRPGFPGADPRALASFPLVPFCNRVSDARFAFGNRNVELFAVDGEPHALHGDGWTTRWDVAESTESSAILTLTRPAGIWPWRYRAWQNFTLGDNRLTIELGVTNLSDEPMPAGLGIHPYFERPAKLTATVDGVWNGPSIIPDRWEEHRGFRSTEIDSMVCDNTYTGWDGRALIELPGARVTLISNLPLLHIYAPKGGGFFCAEPVSGAPDALNRPERGVVVVEPDQSFISTTSLVVG